MKEEKSEHARLQNTAIRWLYVMGCSVFGQEIPTKNGIADALGIRTRNDKHVVYYIEAKASRSDLICKKQKLVYEKAVGIKTHLLCYYHNFNAGQWANDPSRPRSECHQCIEDEKQRGQTGIDFYYLIVANGVKVEPELYPQFGVLDHNGNIVRRAKRMKREDDTKDLIKAIAHVLVYKVFGKMYQA